MKIIVSGFRKFHRQLSIIFCIPLILMTLTGAISPILQILNLEGAAEFVRKVHSGRLFFGSAYLIYTTISGLDLLSVFITGLSILRLFRSKHK